MRQRPIDTKADPIVVIGLVPRFYLGAIFAVSAYAKIFSPKGYVEAVHGFLIGPGAAGAPAWYSSFIATAIIPHMATWATAVVGGEVLIAVSMIFGLFTRMGAAVAIYMLVNYMFAKGLPIWSPASNDAADIMLAFVVLMTGPGRIFGVDRLLSR